MSVELSFKEGDMNISMLDSTTHIVPDQPLYLANRYYLWSERTSFLQGGGLTWMTAIVVDIVAIVVSLVYWVVRYCFRRIK